MSKLVVIGGVLLFAGVGVTALSVLMAYSEYTYPYPGEERVVISDRGAAIPESFLKRQAQLKEAAQQGRFPKAVTDEREYDFGVMNPLTMGTHTFVVRNDGVGPLELRKGGTTCKCTLSKVTGGMIAPGEQGEVTLTWNTGRHPAYSHGATILTNDPDQPRLEFRVHGTVRMRLGSTRESLFFSRLEPDESATAETVVYSQIYDELPLHAVTCSLEGAVWDIEPAGEETLQKLQATAGYVVRLTTPQTLPSGKFYGMLNLTFDIPPEDRLPGDKPIAGSSDGLDNRATQTGLEGTPVAGGADDEADEPGQTYTFQLLASGAVMHRLSVYGDGVDEEGVVHFGVVDQGKGSKMRLIMKVRDKERELLVKRVDVRPEFVQVNVAPFGGEGRRGLYYLDVEVPRDAPPCHHIDPSKQGELRIEFDHPRIKDLKLKLELAVAPGGI
jgi:hypothetical protein